MHHGGKKANGGLPWSPLFTLSSILLIVVEDLLQCQALYMALEVF